jgi:hypothetical protein
MKIIINILLVFVVITPDLVWGQDTTKTEKAIKIVPLITSSPLMGFGFGVAASGLYFTDGGISSKSQVQVGGQYSNTKSYNVFIRNNAWFKNNTIFSNTVLVHSGINNEFISYGEDVSYNANTLLFSELLMFKVAKHVYVGSPLSYKGIKYDANNQGGEDFLYKNGIVDETTGGFGLASSYDTRKNKYYPTSAKWLSLKVNSNPTWLGASDSYYSFMCDARYYAKGFSKKDVWAWQFYGQYSSDKTPDSGLPTLSGKAMLRGFPAGQFKAKYMSGAQTEYRYTIGDSKFRVTSFYGIANLAGGSLGVDGRSREDDGWYTAGGLGIRYALQAITGVDLRLDLVRTSEGENALYLMLNQAF